MNDKLIINTISKIYFTIISFFSFIFLILVLLFFLLQNGLYIQNFSIQNLKTKQLYIKWNEKLILQAKEISIHKDGTKDKEFTHKDFPKALAQISLFTTWFEEVSLENIRYNQFTSSIHYKENEKSSLHVDAVDFTLDATLKAHKHNLHIEITSFKDLKRDLLAKGDIVIDLNNTEVFSLLDLSFGQEGLGTFALFAQKQQLEYALNFQERFYKTKQLLSLIDLPKEIHFWARDAIELESLELLRCYGTLDYDKPQDFLSNILIEARAHKLKYTYNLQLDAIRTEYTNLKFDKGILFIYPQVASSYGMDLGKSWLQIDFTQKDEILTLYLLFEASLNKDILNILQKYKINIPFYQHTGSVVTNLRLQVNLMSIDVDAKGNFYTKEGNFDYQKMNLDVSNLRVLLDNYDIKINGMQAKYQDLASATVNVDYNAKTSKGAIRLAFDTIALKEYNLFLQNNQDFLDVKYTIAPKNSSLFIAPSQWNYLGETLSLPETHFAFNIDTLAIKLPPIELQLEDLLTLKLQGDLDLIEETAALDLTLQELDYLDLKLAQKKQMFKFSYKDQKATLFSDSHISLEYKELPLEIHAPRVELYQNTMQVKSKQFQISTLSTSKTFLEYNLTKQMGIARFADLIIQDKEDQTLFEKERVSFRFNKNKEDTYKVFEEDLALYLIKTKEDTKLFLQDLTKIIPFAPSLKHYKISQGKASFSQNQDDLYTDITLKTPYAPLIKGKDILQDYTIKGMLDLQNNNYNFNINDAVDISIAKDITIDAQNIGVNVNGFMQLLDAVGSTEQGDGQDISFKGTNTPLILDEKRRILVDTLSFLKTKDLIKAFLIHKGARADLKLEQEDLTLYGDRFNDTFMENLFGISKFRGGEFTFSLNGSDGIYDAAFYLKETNILEYTLLNNIFAFVNTLPALTSLSLPKYSKEGLMIKNGFVHGLINTKKQTILLKDIYIASDELQLTGRGDMNYKNDTVDLLLNIKTNIADKVSKIPVVGYLIFDGQSVSTTLSVSGALSDPKINSHLASDIIVAPLNIIKRTFFLPYHILKDE